MATDTFIDRDFEWLDMLQPTGLVVGTNLLRTLGCIPDRQTQAESSALEALLDPDTEKPALADSWAFARTILGWETKNVAGAPGGEFVPDDLVVRLPEHDTTLVPKWAVRELGSGDRRFQLLVSIHTGVDIDKRGALEGWEATPHQRFERLLRETGVNAGLIIADKEIRLVYAPKGETSGWLSFPIRGMATVAGRPMLGGLKLLLDSTRLVTDATDRRLPALLARSRVEQAAVSTALAEQVLGALYELLRGLDAADPDGIRALAANAPDHVYEGLLTVLMRLVFVLYAEDRDLLPSLTDAHARDVYDRSYSLRGLYGKLVEDAALYPDTMDERRGGWGRLLALFRLIHAGHPSHFVQARGGKLFNPDVFLFLEGRAGKNDPPRVLNVSDGCLLRILDGLMTIKGQGSAGRERLSYRSLDVEQIGSVYETVMGFKADEARERMLAIRAGKNNRTPVFVPLETLLAQKGKDRIKFLKEQADRALSASQAKPLEAAKTVEDLAAALDPIVDERASPRKQIAPPGTPILQPTDERRRTGSHYTPRSLTRPIVQHALAPALERLGPDAAPEEILDLKVCDPAMGSGAFLVEACRALAARLVKAWARWPEKRPTIPADEDEELHARRLVAQRCLYGIDKNHLATDLAKLSLWLATLARDHEFTFLDHALKSGDSLVGLTQSQIAAVHWDESKPGLPLFRKLVADRVQEATNGRAEIQQAPDDVSRAIQEARHKSLDAKLNPVRTIGDAVIAAFFSADKPKAREKARAEVESILAGRLDEAAWEKLRATAARARVGFQSVTPFHWQIEFPEVFVRENCGFDAIVGNPPFQGGTQSTETHGVSYTAWLTTCFGVATSRINIVSYFFLRSFNSIRDQGSIALLSTNKISQGDTREQCLLKLINSGGAIYRAVKSMKWPGEADVVVSILHIARGGKLPQCHIDGRSVSRISAYLNDSTFDETPQRLTENAGKAFMGTKITGVGFTFDDKEAEKGNCEPTKQMRALVSQSPQCAAVIHPFVGAEEINNTSDHAFRRYVIDLTDYPEEVAQDRWPDLMQVLRRFVKPERDKLLKKGGWSAEVGKNWWKLAQRSNRLNELKSHLGHVIATASSAVVHHMFAYVDASPIFSHKLIIVAIDSTSDLGVLQSRIHEIWSRMFGTTFGSGDALTYSTRRVFETFPMPRRGIDDVANRYLSGRAAILNESDCGLTETFGRFHNSGERSADIVRLRELHAEMDRAVLRAYGWDDLAARAEPIFLDESNEDDHAYQGRLFWPSDFRDEVLARLLALNAGRHADEVRRGVAPGSKDLRDIDEDGSDME